MFAHQGHGFCGFRARAIGQTSGVLRLIGDRAGVIAHAAIDSHIGVEVGDVLPAAHGVERDARRSDQGSTRLTQQTGELEIALTAGRHHRFGNHLNPAIDARGIVRGHITDAQATAHIQIAGLMAQAASQHQGISQHSRQVAVGLHFKNL